jgi:hypothetical protein
MILATDALASVRITEFMSEGQGDTGQGNGGRRQREFFELTNLGNAAVDVSTWSYNDNNTNDPHNWGPTVGTLLAGESIIFTQMTADHFRSYWGLSTNVRIFSYLQLSNLGNADTINIYNSFTQNASTLVDSLIYTADARGSGVAIPAMLSQEKAKIESQGTFNALAARSLGSSSLADRTAKATERSADLLKSIDNGVKQAGVVFQ